MNLYKKVENILYNYDNTKCEIKNILIEIYDIENSYRGVGAIQYSDMPKANNTNSSVEQEIEQKEKRIEYLNRLMIKKENEIQRVDNAIEVLTAYEHKIINMCYFEKAKVKDVAIALDVTEQTVCRNKSIIINKMSKLIFIE